MLQSIILKVIAFPLLLGVIIALASYRFERQKNLVLAFLAPLFACIIILVLDGFPAFPPVRAAHKFPYILFAGSLFFAFFAWRSPRLNIIYSSLAFVLMIVLPIWWMGKSILVNNGQKATVVMILVLLTVAGAVLYRYFAVAKAKPLPNVLPQALFATSIAGALIAIMGGYMGMLMFNTALAVMFGGYLFISYVRYLRGDAQAFALNGQGALAMSWVAFIGVLVTGILAPKASGLALVLAVFTLAAVPLAYIYAPVAARIPYMLRPLLLGVIVAVPALAGILVAGMQFAG
ncbi:hypothetical protein ACFQ3K_17680 [Brucella gallinifaecis]|uniref:Uncharacterized protein n=1 Tax=Brucella gallinifaecis TaxID=215590 RepID=A0A502BJ10_9HYPH|nr:hypothetical protein [Brucella gallinifaecis]TPF74104.1 hypothetical protein FHY56_16025 [Brucella gallinifaecis]